MIGRARRWAVRSLVLLGLAAAVMAAGLAMLLRFDAAPRAFEERSFPGPDDQLIRSLSWTEPGSWVDRPRRVHEYSLVDPRDGSERRIGRGEEPLDAEALHTNGERAELVVGERIFRRTAADNWHRFDAKDGGFLYRHWSPLPGGRRQGGTHWWRYHAPRQRCRIRELAQQENRLVSVCGREHDESAPKVALVFVRAGCDAPWEIDAVASFAERPPPAHTPFPRRVEGALTILRAVPVQPLRGLDSVYDRLNTARARPGVEERVRVPFTLTEGARREVSVSTGGYAERWYARGGWLDPQGWPVLFWSEHEANEGHGELFAAPFGIGALVQHSIVPREQASYLVYLKLEVPVSD